MKNIFKYNENDMYVVKVLKSPFFWVFAFFFFIPWLSHEIGHYFQTSGYRYEVGWSIPFLDYLLATHFYEISLINIFYNMNNLYSFTHNSYELFQVFSGIIGMTELLALSLSLRSFPVRKNLVNYSLFVIFILTLPFSIFASLIMAI